MREALGVRLRGFRKDAGFSSGRAFAAATGWQESKVSRIENGRQNASEDDIRVWCGLTGHETEADDLIATLRHIDELWMEWRRMLESGAERRQKKSLPLYRKTKVFRIWDPNVVWGTIQTSAYAENIFQQVSAFHETPADTEAAVARRLDRQQYLYEGNRIFNVLLGEQALYSNHGGSEVMRAQLDRLMAVMALPRLSLGIVPRTAPLALWIGHAFSMFDDRLVMIETYSAEISVTQPREIELYHKAFGLHRQSAVYGQAARDLILTAIEHFERMGRESRG
ncbi:helix-turn-helix domain-containing protein [Streptomyces zagrosensis]|uniref:Transcriptional regulator with XRE-family HTH domain n=1 Tax=Streptomyces zagrosensis TaxID=1042984 RepID=A0A7W9QFS9_9ACTN|nr:helix-turn-helix transcriptional regulator [Streptomyces zagrosensis]MBB5938923.1 transcriptional regulator with XRE-family HTH domain [Streptomyces zagrosensis]